jgi:hypothetical protein
VVREVVKGEDVKKIMAVLCTLTVLSGCSFGQGRETKIVNNENSKIEVLAAWTDIRLLEENVLFKYEDEDVTCYMSERGGLFCFQKEKR